MLAAAEKTGMAVVNFLLTEVDVKASVNERDKKGYTALHHACISGCLDVVKILIKAGASINDVATSQGETPLTFAVRRGHVDIVRYLVENKADVNINQLFHAVQKGVGGYSVYWNVVRILLSTNVLGEDINLYFVEYQERPKQYVLHLAALANQSDVVKQLIQIGADRNIQNDYGETALHIALKNGHVTLAEQLVADNANPHITDRDGNTAFELAVEKGYVDVVNSIIEKARKCSLNISEQLNKALFIATSSTEERGKVISSLLEAGANPNKTDEDGSTVLHLACEKLSPEHGDNTILALLSAHPNANVKNGSGYTALHLAVKGPYDRTNIVCRLVRDFGADPTIQTDTGDTPLHLAVRNGHIGVAKFLMELGGAGLDITNKNGELFFEVGAHHSMQMKNLIKGYQVLHRIGTSHSYVSRFFAKTSNVSPEDKQQYAFLALGDKTLLSQLLLNGYHSEVMELIRDNEVGTIKLILSPNNTQQILSRLLRDYTADEINTIKECTSISQQGEIDRGLIEHILDKKDPQKVQAIQGLLEADQRNDTAAPSAPSVSDDDKGKEPLPVFAI